MCFYLFPGILFPHLILSRKGRASVSRIPFFPSCPEISPLNKRKSEKPSCSFYMLACARVFLANPGLVILDEASSRLDPATEALIEQAIARILENRTALIIAHRLSTLRRVDEILVMEDGHIQEYGPRAALMDNPTSRFAQLLQSEIREALT